MNKVDFARSLCYLRVPEALHRALYPQALSIVMYHGVVDRETRVRDWCFLDVRAFRKQMEYLKSRFQVLSLHEAVERLQAGEIHKPTAAITFDDGYQSTLDLAYPVLKELNLPATVFLCTDLVGSDETVWFCRLLEALTETRRTQICWRGKRFPLDSPAALSRAAAALQSCLKVLPPYDLTEAVDEISWELGYDPMRPICPHSPYRILDASSLERMSRQGLIEFGAHTASHVILSKLAEREKRAEIRRSIAAVKTLCGGDCRYFAYPNGSIDDYDESSIHYVREAGVRAAFTTIQRPNTTETPRFEMRRYGVGCDMSMAEYQFSVHHVKSLYHRWSFSARKGADLRKPETPMAPAGTPADYQHSASAVERYH